jgi:beta-lactamase superfamily II metal-dependent hydrolase
MLEGAPNEDTIEVSVFGPGRGESIAVHLGAGDWIVVDSCKNQATKQVAVLEYLRALGVDISSKVHLVVATHAHDDHFSGIATIFEECRSATFVCPAALSIPEFVALTDVEEREYAGLPVRAYAEYRKVFQIVEERGSGSFDPVDFAMAKMELLTLGSSSANSRVVALSPSSKAYKQAQRAIRKAYAECSAAPNYFNPVDPNQLALALWVEAADKRLLLGADLLKGPRGSGWDAIVAFFHPDIRASLFKVPHHGSSTAYWGGVWSQLVAHRPTVVMTPFRMGAKSIPRDSDKTRILSLAGDAYISAPPIVKTPTLETRKEAAAMGPLALAPRDPWGVPGHIRARSRVGTPDWTVELDAPAARL